MKALSYALVALVTGAMAAGLGYWVASVITELLSRVTVAL